MQNDIYVVSVRCDCVVNVTGVLLRNCGRHRRSVSRCMPVRSHKLCAHRARTIETGVRSPLVCDHKQAQTSRTHVRAHAQEQFHRSTASALLLRFLAIDATACRRSARRALLMRFFGFMSSPRGSRFRGARTGCVWRVVKPKNTAVSTVYMCVSVCVWLSLYHTESEEIELGAYARRCMWSFRFEYVLQLNSENCNMRLACLCLRVCLCTHVHECECVCVYDRPIDRSVSFHESVLCVCAVHAVNICYQHIIKYIYARWYLVYSKSCEC